MSHGTFCFMSFDGYGWYLSSTAALLYCSYFTHNVVAWMKIKPFFTGEHPSFGPRYCKAVHWIYLITLAMTIPALIFEIYNNFRFFNNYSRLYQKSTFIRTTHERPLVVIQLCDSVLRNSKDLQLEVLQIHKTFPSIWYHACCNISGDNLYHRRYFIINNPRIKRHRWVHSISYYVTA